MNDDYSDDKTQQWLRATLTRFREYEGVSQVEQGERLGKYMAWVQRHVLGQGNV